MNIYINIITLYLMNI